MLKVQISRCFFTECFLGCVTTTVVVSSKVIVFPGLDKLVLLMCYFLFVSLCLHRIVSLSLLVRLYFS